MKTLTVFTPTYNRAYCLHRVYESLERQTCKDFEWLVVDDGSVDETWRIVGQWQGSASFTIRYVYQENQGMHGAHNTAYELINTELNVCIDSDDYMADDAVEKIVTFWQQHGSERYSGIAGLDAEPGGRIIGTRFPMRLKSATLFALYHRHRIKGDKKLVYRSALTKQFPYPLFPGERYVGLAYKYYKLDEQYELLLLDEILCHVEYLADGSSQNMLRQYRRNPQGFAFYRVQLMQLRFGNPLFKFRQAIHYVSSKFLIRKQTKHGNKIGEIERPGFLAQFMAWIPGLLLYLWILSKTRDKASLKGVTHDYSVD